MNRKATRPTPELGRGPRLFAGDHYVLMRKYGAVTELLHQGLSQEPIVLTVTGASGGEGDAHVRIHYLCPRGVYVETRRAAEMAATRNDLRTQGHRHLTITRKVGEAFLIRPFPGREQQAAQELASRAILVTAEEGFYGDEATIHIFASDCWEILRSELVMEPEPASAPEAPFTLEAFRFAAERLLSQEQLDEIAEVARALTRKRPACR